MIGYVSTQRTREENFVEAKGHLEEAIKIDPINDEAKEKHQKIVKKIEGLSQNSVNKNGISVSQNRSGFLNGSTGNVGNTGNNVNNADKKYRSPCSRRN